jgi:hypothetical protein
MSVPSRVFVVMACLVVAIGAWLDVAQAQGVVTVPVTCDTKCRMRTQHYFCGERTCLWFWNTTCNCCNPYYSNYNCVDRGDYDPLRPACFPPDVGSTETGVDIYDTCNPLCNCGSLLAVEAEMTGVKIDDRSMTKFICRSQPS